MNRICILMMLMLFVSVSAMAQKPKPVKVKAEETYISDNKNESIKQAEEKAFFRARCKALVEEFGARIGGITDIITISENGQTSVKFRQQGGTEILADWLKTIKEEVRGRSITDDGFMVVTVYVEGMAREIKMAGLDFEYHVLRNGNKIENEDDRFRNKDRVFLMFKAPVDGYLAIYLTDDKRAYCMLPYNEQTDGIYRIRHNQQYVFFSEENAQTEEKNYDLRLRLVTDKQYEENTLYIIFSQEPFTKKTDEDGHMLSSNLMLARNIDIDEFKDWLYQCQRKDVQMRVEKKTITITK